MNPQIKRDKKATEATSRIQMMDCCGIDVDEEQIIISELKISSPVSIWVQFWREDFLLKAQVVICFSGMAVLKVG